MSKFTNRFRSVLGLGLLAATSLLGACASSRTVPLDGGYGGAQPVYNPNQGGGQAVPVAYMPVAPEQQMQPMPPSGPVVQPAPAAPQQSFAPAPPAPQAQPQQFAAAGQQMTRGQKGLQVCQNHVLQEVAADAQSSGDQATIDKIGRITGGTIGAVGNGVWGSKKTDGLSRVGAGAGLGMLAGDVFTGAGQLIGGANKNAAMSDAFNAARAGNAGLVDDEPIAYYPGDDGRVYKVFWGGSGVMQVAVNKP